MHGKPRHSRLDSEPKCRATTAPLDFGLRGNEKAFLVHEQERRIQSISYVLGFLAVLTVVHTKRDGATRVISFRHASREEREVYDDWLENEYDEP